MGIKSDIKEWEKVVKISFYATECTTELGGEKKRSNSIDIWKKQSHFKSMVESVSPEGKSVEDFLCIGRPIDLIIIMHI